uniref:alpha-N-acetylgalactosaminide alpha-2,6-sialyltransferase n=1 Tax=Gouania willdenowi TaxID=441366 RepID=A0A8C5HU18_GOUWI
MAFKIIYKDWIMESIPCSAVYIYIFSLSSMHGQSERWFKRFLSWSDRQALNPFLYNKSTRHVRVRPETPMPVMSRKTFRSIPHWDFEDVYIQDSPPRPATCSHSEDEEFRKLFLPNIRLYLHKNNINVSEWNRLSHFNSPFGFMGEKYEELMPAIKLIPEPKEPLLVPKPGGDGCIHCAVVGTGGILNGSKKGAEIDAHDYIFRMNGAITKGFEVDVGSRTSVYVHTAHAITSSSASLKKFGYTGPPSDEGIKFVMIPEGFRDYRWLGGLLSRTKIPAPGTKRPWKFYSGQFNESRFYVLHQDFLRYIRNRFLNSVNLNRRFWAIVRPTNGAFTIFLALHTCDTVSVYGFMTEDYGNYSNYYYHKHKSKVIFYANHDYKLEKKTWKDFHERKILKLFERDETKPEMNK